MCALGVIAQYTTTIAMHHVKCAIASVLVLDALLIQSEREDKLSQKRGVPHTVLCLKNVNLNHRHIKIRGQQIL